MHMQSLIKNILQIEGKKKQTSILLSNCCLETKQMQLEIEENFTGLKGDDSPLSEGQTPFLIVPYGTTCW